MSQNIMNMVVEPHLTTLGGDLSSPVDFFTSTFFRSFKISSSSTYLKEKAASFFVALFVSITLG